MSNGVKLGCFFAVSVALHGAGLWALAGTLEPRSASPTAEVTILDRDLFFRQAARVETRASQSVSAIDRLDAASGDVVRPSPADESVQPALAQTATVAEPERRNPQAAENTVVARLDRSAVEPARPLVQEMVPLGNIRADRTEPVRLSGVAAARQLPAVRAPVQRAAAVEQASRARTYESVTSAGPVTEATLVIAPQLQPTESVAEVERARAVSPDSAPQRVYRPVGAEAQLARASAADTLAGTDAERADRRTIEEIARLEASPWPVRAPLPAPVPEIEREAAEAARPLAAVDSPPLEPPAVLDPAGEVARVAAVPSPPVSPVAPQAPVSEVAPWQTPREPERIAAYGRRPALRGTLAPDVLAPREPRAMASADAPAVSRPPDHDQRLRAADAVELARVGPSVTIVPRRAVPPVERLAARTPPSASSATRTDPAPVAEVESREARAPATPAPATPAPPAEISGGPAPDTSDPADRFTRSYRGGECFFPLRVASSDGNAIRGYGLRPESVRMFSEAFAQALGTAPNVDWRPLTDAQCTGISFTRLILGQSAPSVHIGLARKELEKGEELAGQVTGSRFDFVTLLVVDDSGHVHNVLEYLRPESSKLEFSVPVHPVDDGADRVQLIMAVGASKALPALESTVAVHSDDFFPELLNQAREAGATLELGLEDFVILDGPTPLPIR